MEAAEVTILALVLLFVLLAIGMPIALVLGGVSVLGLLLLGGVRLLSPLANFYYTGINGFVLVAVPLFLLMGEILFVCGMGAQLYEVASKWLGKFPGGLAIGSTIANAVFGAMCGAGVAAVAAIGVVAIPEMRKRGYGTDIAAGTVAAAGGLSMLIPPSIPVILYATVTDASVGRLFAACIVPGVILTLLMCIYLAIVVKLGKATAPAGESVSWAERFRALSKIWSAMVLILLVLGAIYTGFSTPTEAAGVGAFGAMLIARFVYKKFDWAALKKVLFNTTQATSMVLLLVANALIFGYFLTRINVPQTIISTVIAAKMSPLVVLIVINMLFFILGMFLDISSTILIGMPVVLPVAEAMGFDLVWLGVIVAINMLMAFITPPVGLGLFVVQGLAPDIPITTIIRGALPFVICEAIAIVLVVIFPDLALWLPGKMF